MELILLSQNNCAPCKELKLFLENEDIEVTEINLSKPENSELVKLYDVMSTPVTILLDDDDEEVVRVNGATSDAKEDILELSEQL